MNTTLTQELARLDPGPHRACLVTKDKKLARAVTRTLVPRDIRVDHLDQMPGPDDGLPEYRFVLIDGDFDDPAEIENGIQRLGALQNRVIIFSQNHDKAHLAKLLGSGNLTNVIAKNSGIREDELLVTMHKLLTGEFFGMAQYLAHGTKPVERIVPSESDRPSALTELVEFLSSCLVSKRFTELARTAADELLRNALVRAPMTAAAESAEPAPNLPVTLRYACDGRHVGISVADEFGTLTPDRLIGFLGRCFTRREYEPPQDTIGGGLGLYVAFRSADQFVVNIAQGIRTEVICLIDIRGHLRDFEGRSKSLHLFIREGAQCPTT